jgi:hypothetical protein
MQLCFARSSQEYKNRNILQFLNKKILKGDDPNGRAKKYFANFIYPKN